MFFGRLVKRSLALGVTWIRVSVGYSVLSSSNRVGAVINVLMLKQGTILLVFTSCKCPIIRRKMMTHPLRQHQYHFQPRDNIVANFRIVFRNYYSLRDKCPQ